MFRQFQTISYLPTEPFLALVAYKKQINTVLYSSGQLMREIKTCYIETTRPKQQVILCSQMLSTNAKTNSGNDID